MEMAEKKDKIKVLFQSTNPQLFRTTLVGYLYEISQRYRVVLLAEQMDFHMKSILRDKNIFPGLEKILFFSSAFNGGIFKKNRQLAGILEEAVQGYKPDVVIAPSDIWPAEMYLMRFAKRNKAITVAVQPGFKMARGKEMCLWSCLMNSHLKMSIFLPLSIRMFLARIKKHLAHFFYHWILPIAAGEIPFFGKTSFVFWDEASGLRDADYSAVFSKRDYDLSVKDGVNPEKIFVIGHPLEHKETRNFFEKYIFPGSRNGENPRTLTIMWPDEEIAFSRDRQALISGKKLKDSREKIVRLISERLPGWKIFVKPHPAAKNFPELKIFLGSISKNISVADPSEPADKYIEKSSVIAGMPLPSTSLFTASLQNPEKAILFLDLNHEFLGDAYKDFNGIEYIDDEKKLADVLVLINNGRYRRDSGAQPVYDFTGINELLDHISHEKHIS